FIIFVQAYLELCLTKIYHNNSNTLFPIYSIHFIADAMLSPGRRCDGYPNFPLDREETPMAAA
ncbi:MAG TPA: hypothetical protein VGN34_08015, partial [Ktedonobacteraceae bacterium]